LWHAYFSAEEKVKKLEGDRDVQEAEADATRMARRVADQVKDFVFGKRDKLHDKNDKNDKASTADKADGRSATSASSGRLNTTRRVLRLMHSETSAGSEHSDGAARRQGGFLGRYIAKLTNMGSRAVAPRGKPTPTARYGDRRREERGDDDHPRGRHDRSRSRSTGRQRPSRRDFERLDERRDGDDLGRGRKRSRTRSPDYDPRDYETPGRGRERRGRSRSRSEGFHGSTSVVTPRAKRTPGTPLGIRPLPVEEFTDARLFTEDVSWELAQILDLDCSEYPDDPTLWATSACRATTVLKLNVALRALALPEHRSHNKEGKMRELATAVMKAGPAPETPPIIADVD
jgi:hypothetical protein